MENEFETIILQAENLSIDTSLANNDGTLARTRTQNQEKDGRNGLGADVPDEGVGPEDEFDDYGLRLDYSGDGYVDLNGAAGDKLSFDVNGDSGLTLPAGTYDISLRVAANSTREIRLKVLDGATVETTTAAQDGNSGEFFQWKVLTFQITIPDGAPARTIMVEQMSSQGPNVDAIAISAPGAEVTFAAPVIETESLTVAENETVAGQVVATDLQDVTGTDSTLSYAIVGGADADKLTIDDAGGLTFNAAPDHEAPGDDNGDNVYDVTVEVSDGARTSTQDISVTVTDVLNELPNPAISQIVLQGEDALLSADGESYARTQATARIDLADGYQQGDQFAEGAANSNKNGNVGEPLDGYGLREGYSGAGYLDFESGTDEAISWTVTVAEAGNYDLHIRYANGDQPRPLDIVVGGTVQHGSESFASTGFQTWVVKTLTVQLEAGANDLSLAISGNTNGPNIDALALTSVGEVASFPPSNSAPAFAETGPASVEVDENTSAAGAFAATDADPDDIVEYALSGVDAGSFEIDAAGNLAFATAPDFETDPTSYEVTVEASDGKITTSRNVTVTVADVDEANEAPVSVSLDASTVAENADGAIIGTLSATDPDGDDAAIVFSIDPASDFEIEGTTLKLKEGVSLDHEAAEAVSLDVTATDADGVSSVQTFSISVGDVNEAPSITGPATLTPTVPAGGGLVDLSGLAVIDPDEADMPTLGVRLAGGGAAPAGVDIDASGDLVIPAGLPAGDLDLEIFATDGTLELGSASSHGDRRGRERPSYTVPSEGELVIQLETRDGSVVINDDTPGEGEGDADATQFRDASNPEGVQEGRDDGLWNGYQGTGYLDMGGQAGDQATFDVTVDMAGEYTFAFRYNNGSSTFNGGIRPMDIAVNGTVLATPSFANNGLDWTDWQIETVTLTLPEGTSTISLTNTVANGPNFDQVTITPPAVVNEAPVANDTAVSTPEDTATTIDVADLITDDVDADADLTVIAETSDGTVTVEGTSILFTPAADFSGDAVITYRVVDSEGAVSEDATLTVSVTAEDDAPTAVTVTPIAVSENVAGAAVATIVVDDVDTVYAAGDLVLGGDAGLFELEGTETPNTFTLKLLETEALDFEAEAQPSVTVSVGGVTSEPLTPAPSDDLSDNPPQNIEIDFGTAEITSYTGNQDASGSVAPSEDGTSAEFAGNLWKRVALGQDYTISNNTKLEVTVEAGTPLSEMVAIGFDLDEDFSDGDRTIYQLAGTQRYTPFVDLSQAGTDNGDGTTTYEIDLSAHAGVTISSLVFVADDDNAGNGTGTPVFSNVSLIEDTSDAGDNVAPAVVGGGIADLKIDEGSALEIDLPFVDSDGPQPLSYSYAILDGEGADVTDTFGLTLEAGVLSGTLGAGVAPGSYTITVTADDGEAATAETFTVTVENVNDAPVVAPGVAPEPVVGKVGEPIPGIDLAQFDGVFSDPDGDALTITVEGLPDGLSIDGEGVIVGTPNEAGAGFFTIVATDPEGLRAELQIPLQLSAPAIGDVVVVEAEDFTGLADAAEFYVTGQAGASGDQIIRVAGAGDVASITTNLTQNGLLDGWYQVSMTRYDETDGSATYSLQVGDTILADGAAFDGTPDQESPNDTFDTSNGRGNAGQSGNLKTITFDTAVYVDTNTILTLSGVANGELLRTDRFTFTRVEEPNVAPSAPSLDTSAVAENSDDVTIGVLSATDPDGDDAAITYSVDEASPFEVVGDELRLKAGEAFDFEADGASVDVDVTATDASGASSRSTLTISITDVDEAPTGITVTNSTVTENDIGAVVGTLQSADPEGAAVSYSVDDARFEVVGGDQLTLKAGEALDFEAEPTVTVNVTATDETGNATVTALTLSVTDANDAPVIPVEASIADQSVDAGTGATIDLASLGATDADAGDTVSYTIAGDAALDAGFAVEADGTTLTVPASAPSGTYEVTVFASDGAADSDFVSFTITVGEPAPFQPFAIEAENEALTSVSLAQPADDNSTQVRDPQNIESNPDLANGLRPGFSGDGYLDFGNDAGDTATFSVTVPATGRYDLNIRYASNTDRPLDLTVNGSGVGALPFTSTDPDGTGQEEGFDHWLFETVTVDLVAGANTVALAIPAGATSGPNIDRIEITAPGTGPIPVDESADADEFPLSLDGDTGELTPTQAASINFNVTGIDADVVTVELSFDGGASRQDVTALLDSDGDFVIDGSGLAAGPQTATVIVTDAAGNEAENSLSFSIADPDNVTFDPVTLQGEDAALTDVPGTGTGSEIVTLRDGDTDAFGNTVGVERTGALGEDAGYLDYGNTPGELGGLHHRCSLERDLHGHVPLRQRRHRRPAAQPDGERHRRPDPALQPDRCGGRRG